MSLLDFSEGAPPLSLFDFSEGAPLITTDFEAVRVIAATSKAIRVSFDQQEWGRWPWIERIWIVNKPDYLKSTAQAGERGRLCLAGRW